MHIVILWYDTWQHTGHLLGIRDDVLPVSLADQEEFYLASLKHQCRPELASPKGAGAVVDAVAKGIAADAWANIIKQTMLMQRLLFGGAVEVGGRGGGGGRKPPGIPVPPLAAPRLQSLVRGLLRTAVVDLAGEQYCGRMMGMDAMEEREEEVLVGGGLQKDTGGVISRRAGNSADVVSGNNPNSSWMGSAAYATVRWGGWAMRFADQRLGLGEALARSHVAMIRKGLEKEMRSAEEKRNGALRLPPPAMNSKL
jgi:hypothetical protein